jgi:hypothetical protein
MHPKKCEEKREYTLEELFTRLIVASKHKNIVNVSYETHGNITVINID